jgi:hypothetical protein
MSFPVSSAAEPRYDSHERLTSSVRRVQGGVRELYGEDDGLLIPLGHFAIPIVARRYHLKGIQIVQCRFKVVEMDREVG